MLTLADFKPFSFPGGERHFQLTDHVGPGPLKAVIRSSDDLMDLILVRQWMRQCQNRDIHMNPHLFLPYVPYARQDRATTAGSPFSLKAFAAIINSLEFQSVSIYEPHSDVAPALLDNCIVRPMLPELVRFVELQTSRLGNGIALAAPDAGAAKRVERAYRACRQGNLEPREPIQILKHRDPATGRLEITGIYGDVENLDVLLVDDICDGGATFVQAAQCLYEEGARSVMLFVAHGIFSKGVDVLRDAGITRIGTTDSYYQPRSSELVFGDRFDNFVSCFRIF